MAGIVPTPGKSTSGRKQWTLHDGPRGSLRRLRNQLAEDGCSESQVVLAKQLLSERCDLEVDKIENARLAVYWLIKSSEQGNTEATNLLKKCFQTGKGINEHNYIDVKSCIDMTQDEKLARKAAREMFASLSNGEDFITSDQLQKRMIEIYKTRNGPQKVNFLNGHITGEPQNGEIMNSENTLHFCRENWSRKIEIGNEKLTEDDLVSAAVNYAHGELPDVNTVLCLSEPNPRSLNHIPYFHRSLLHPILTSQIFYFKVMRLIGNQPYSKLFPLILTNVQLLILLFIYSLLGTDSLILFFPMILYCLSFVAMTVTTFQILNMKHGYQDYRIWSQLFLCYSNGSLNAQEAEYQFIRNNLTSYGHFFLSLLLNLMVYPMVAAQWIPQSEITVSAFALTFITLIMNGKSDILMLFSFAINVLAKYPYESDMVVTQGWRFLDLNAPSFTSYVIGNGVEFCLNFRAIFFVIIPVCFFKLAAREKWRGTYKYLIPHCVTLSWLQIVIISSQGATMYGLLRSTLALVGFVLFLPLAGLTSILLPTITVLKYVYESDWMFSIAMSVVIILMFIVGSWLVTFTQYSPYITHIQIILGVLFLCLSLTTSLFFPNLFQTSAFNKISPLHKSKDDITNQKHTLTWAQFHNYCHQPAWDRSNMAATQYKCSKLDGLPVRWEGYISEVKIRRVHNLLKTVLDKLPSTLKDSLVCFFGSKYEKDCDKVIEEERDDCFWIHRMLSSKCHLNKWDKVEMEIVVKLSSGIWGKVAGLNLIVEDDFKNFTFQLKPNDKIWFSGILTNTDFIKSDTLGGSRPEIRVLEIGCIACHNTELTRHKLLYQSSFSVNEILKYTYLGCKNVFNFLFNPILFFK